jgi:hypothetical protein
MGGPSRSGRRALNVEAPAVAGGRRAQHQSVLRVEGRPIGPMLERIRSAPPATAGGSVVNSCRQSPRQETKFRTELISFRSFWRDVIVSYAEELVRERESRTYLSLPRPIAGRADRSPAAGFSDCHSELANACGR